MNDTQQDMFKEESFSTEERIEEIRRLRKLREDTDKKLVSLSNPTAISQQMSQMAKEGKYISVELNSDDEEISSIIEGTAKETNANRSFMPIKQEEETPANVEQMTDFNDVNSEENQCSADDINAIKKIKAVKRKSRKNISPEFINASFSSEYSMTSFPSGSDCSPKECLETLKTLISSPSRTKEVGRVLEEWNMENSHLFDSDVIDNDTKMARADFIKDKKQKLFLP